MSGSCLVISQIYYNGNSESGHVPFFLQACSGGFLSVANMTRMYLISSFVRWKLQRSGGFCRAVFISLVPSGVCFLASYLCPLMTLPLKSQRNVCTRALIYVSVYRERSLAFINWCALLKRVLQLLPFENCSMHWWTPCSSKELLPQLFTTWPMFFLE